MITSKQNPTVKKVVALRRKQDRQAAGVTLLDGFAELTTALKAGAKPLTLYICRELMAPGQDSLLPQTSVEVVECSRPVFEKIAYRQSPDGWLAVVPAPQTGLERLYLGDSPLLLACEAVEKPGNLGAMLRTANAAGANGVIATNSITDWGNPNIIRASKGAIFATPVADTSNDQLLAWLQNHHIAVVAATPDTQILYTEVDFTQPVAIFVGAEAPGLTNFWLQNATVKVRIPMVGQVDSLNVATSAALLLYEAVRQRG